MPSAAPPPFERVVFPGRAHSNRPSDARAACRQRRVVPEMTSRSSAVGGMERRPRSRRRRRRGTGHLIALVVAAGAVCASLPAQVAALSGGGVGADAAHNKPRLVVDDALVNANRAMELDAADYLAQQHGHGGMSLQRDILVGSYEDTFVQGLRDHRITSSVSKSWFDADSGNLCCSFRDTRVGKDLCHASLAASCRADFGYNVVPVEPGETREGKFSSCCKFVDAGFDSGQCQRTNCVAGAGGGVGVGGGSGADSPMLAVPGGAEGGFARLQAPEDAVRKTVHMLTVPNNVRGEVANLSPQLRSLFFAEETDGKALLERQFGVYVTVDDADTLIVFGSAPASVKRCVLLVEECVKNEHYCHEWYRGERGMEMAHTLVAEV